MIYSFDPNFYWLAGILLIGLGQDRTSVVFGVICCLAWFFLTFLGFA